MAWHPVLPADPVIASGWRRAAEREDAERRAAAADRALVVPALAARVRRAIREIDAALARSTPTPCDCVKEGYRNGCRWCRPPVDVRHAGPTPGHGADEAELVRFELIHRPGGRILAVR